MMTNPTEPWIVSDAILERLRAVIDAELGTAAVDVEIVATADPTKTFRQRTDPAVADHTRVLGDGGIAFLDRSGRIVLAISVGALAGSEAAADFVARHECQHAKALCRGENLREAAVRRGVVAQPVEGVYVGLAAEVVDEFRAERATVERGGPHPEGMTRARLDAAIAELDGAADAQSTYDAWRRCVVSAAYVAGEVTATGGQPPAFDGHPWVSTFVAWLRDQLTAVPDADASFDLKQQDEAIDAVAARMPALLEELRLRINSDDEGLLLEDIGPATQG
jgi:hypothetical protein